MENRRFSCFDLFVTVVSLLTLFVDIGTDAMVISQLYLRGDIIWGSLMLAFTVVPLVVMNVFSLKWHATDRALTPALILPHLLLLAPVHRYVRVLWLGHKSRVTGEPQVTEGALQEQNDVTILRLLETFLESAPQLVIQLYVMIMQPHHLDWIQVLSASCSLLSLGWALTAYSDTLRLNYQTTYQRRFLSLALHCCWRLFMVSARVTALVLFASVYHAWLFLFAGVHWGAMTAWTWYQGADFGQGPVEQALFRVVSGFIHIFVFLNVQDGPTRLRKVLYYSLVGVENAALFALWYARAQPASGFLTVASIVVFLGFVLGGLCMVVYYGWYHPSSPICLFTVEPTLTAAQQPCPQSPQEPERQEGNGPLHCPSPRAPSPSTGTPLRDASSTAGNLTLSFLLDSASKGEVGWHTGLNNTGMADADCSSSNVMDEDGRLSFSLSRSSCLTGLTGRSHSQHSLSPSQFSVTLTSDQGYNSCRQQWSPQSASNDTSVWGPASCWSSESSSDDKRPRWSQRGGRDVQSRSIRCVREGGGGGVKAEAAVQGWQTGRDERRDSRGTDWAVDAGSCSNCSIFTLSGQSFGSERGSGASGVAVSPTCPRPGWHRCPDAAGCDTTLSPLDVNQLWRQALHRVISSTVRDVFPDLSRSACTESSKSSDLSRSACTESSKSSDQDQGKNTSASIHDGCRNEQKSSCSLNKTYVSGEVTGTPWQDISAPLAQPESSDISGRSSPSLSDSHIPPSPGPGVSMLLSGPCRLTTSRFFPPLKSGPSSADVLPSSPSPPVSGMSVSQSESRQPTTSRLFPPLLRGPGSPTVLLSTPPPHTSCSLSDGGHNSFSSPSPGAKVSMWQSVPCQLTASKLFPPLRSGGTLSPGVLLSSPPSHTPCTLHPLRVDLAPCVQPAMCPQLIYQEAAVPVMMVEQLRKAGMEPVPCRPPQLSPLHACCLDHSPQRLGRCVDLFDPRAWRQGLGCPCSPLSPHNQACREEQGTHSACDDVSLSDSGHTSEQEQCQHHSMPCGETRRDGLHRYFIDSDSPDSSCQLDMRHCSPPSVQRVWATPLSGLTHSSHLPCPTPGLAHHLKTDPGPRREHFFRSDINSQCRPTRLTWEEEEEDERFHLHKWTAHQTLDQLDRLEDRGGDRKKAKSKRSPLRPLQNSPHFSPSSAQLDTAPPAAAMRAGSRQRSANSSAVFTASSRDDSQSASSKGQPHTSNTPLRSHRHRYKQAAGRQADRRSASSTSTPQSLASGNQLSPCLR